MACLLCFASIVAAMAECNDLDLKPVAEREREISQEEGVHSKT